MAAITIPAFDDSDAESIADSIIQVPQGHRLQAMRVTGAGTVYLHATKPVDAAEAMAGFPLGANADDPELGECLPLDQYSGGDNPLYATSVDGSALRVLTIS